MIIGITGYKRSGKDTAAKYLAENYGTKDEGTFLSLVFGFHTYHFADPLKRALETIYGWDKGIWDSPEKEEIDPYWGVSPRQAAQILGTEWSILLGDTFPEYKRVTGRKTYLKAFLRHVEEHPDWNFIVPDMRFEYEADAIRFLGGSVLRIRRPEVEQSSDAHASEKEYLTLFADAEYVNDGSLDELYEFLDMYAKILGLESIK